MNMFSKVGAFLLGLTGLIAATSASAPTRLVPLDGTSSAPRDIRILHAFSGCAVRHHFSKTRARAVLAMDPTTPDYQRALVGLAGRSTHCLPGRGSRLRFTPLPFAGGMAEALLEEDNGLRDLAARVALDPAVPPLRAHDEIEVMSICAVRAAPAEVAALFATQPASDAENAALRAIMPRASQCLSAGTSLRLNAMSMRSRLALAAWHLAEHNRASAAAATRNREGQAAR